MNKPVFRATGKSAPPRHTVDVPAGQFIFHQNDLGTEMFIVHEGKVEILQQVGDDHKRLAVMEKGDFFGEMSLLDDMPRNAGARALTDAKLLRINGSTFVQMLRKEPEIAIRIMRKFSRRLRDSDRLLKQALGEGGSRAVLAAEMPLPDSEAQRELGTERLIHDKSGMEFFLLRAEETTVGRKDPVTGIYPGVDLTPVDSQRSTSRRHAKLYRKAEKFYVVEGIGTMNGTFVNGRRLETGVPAEIHDKDELRFGMVTTVFRLS
ncbi:MAG: cyclic nucleotide-binding domain-containing protein [Acidobacteria bacterium]|nr:cyclic nucleotide-binding domain-containing protein [Acidobacteriota bacterium]